MNLSTKTYSRSVQVTDNPENLEQLWIAIEGLNKTDMIAYFPSLSIDNERVYFLPIDKTGILHSRTVLKSGYQSLLGRLGIPFRLVDGTVQWVEMPLVNNMITSMAQERHQSNVMIRLIDDEIRAVLSASYSAIDDLDIVELLETSFLQRIAAVNFTCDHATSNTRIATREQYRAEYNGYSVSMFLYIANSEIGDASVRCGIGITISHQSRNLAFQMARDTRTLGRVIHRGEAIPRLSRQLTTLFDTAANNWQLIQNAFRNMSNVPVERIPHFEEKMIASLKTMPEFEAWKLQYDEMRKTSVVNNMFDLIYLMTSIPYRDENFGSIVEEMLFGRFF